MAWLKKEQSLISQRLLVPPPLAYFHKKIKILVLCLDEVIRRVIDLFEEFKIHTLKLLKVFQMNKIEEFKYPKKYKKFEIPLFFTPFTPLIKVKPSWLKLKT